MVTRKCASPGNKKRERITAHTTDRSNATNGSNGSTSGIGGSSGSYNEIDMNIITFNKENGAETNMTDLISNGNVILTLPNRKTDPRMPVRSDTEPLSGKQLSRAVLSAATATSRTPSVLCALVVALAVSLT